MKLYDISAEAQAIEMLLTDSDGELTPEIEQRMKEFVEGGKEKLENAACVVRSLKAQSDACEAEAKRLKARSASLEANSDRLKALMAVAVMLGSGGGSKPRFSRFIRSRIRPRQPFSWPRTLTCLNCLTIW